MLGLLGCGGFGAVELVEHQGTKETYALKDWCWQSVSPSAGEKKQDDLKLQGAFPFRCVCVCFFPGKFCQVEWVCLI